MSLRSRAATALVAAPVTLAALPAVGQSPAAVGPWRYEATPYVWLSGTRSRSRLGNGPEVRSRLTPSEVLEDLDLALMGTFEARNGPYGITLDAMHARLSDGGSATRVVSSVPVTVRADVRVRQTMVGLAGSYQALSGERPVDLLLGVRRHRVGVDADLTASALGQLQLSRAPAFSRSWWDPFFGARTRVPLAPRWSLEGYADIGGFGVGSDITWQVAAGARYQLDATYAVAFGYRFMRVDYDDDGFRHRADNGGLYGSLGIRF